MANKTTTEPRSNQNSQSERQQAASIQYILPAHKKHPLQKFMQGVLELLTAKVGFSDFIGLSQFCAGTAKHDGTGFQNIGTICDL